MKISALVFPLYFITVYATGEFSVLHSPPLIQFKGNEQLNTENIKDVIMASLGYSVEETAHWPGLILQSPFNVAQAAIAVYVEGVEHLNLKGKVKTYPTTGNSAQMALDRLPSNLEEFNAEVVDLDLTQGTEALLTYPEIFGNIKVPTNLKSEGNLKPSLHSEDKLFLQQIAILHSIADKLDSIEKKPTLITLRISLSPIGYIHKEDSLAMSDALKLLTEAIEKLKTASEKVFKDGLLFVAVADKTEYLRNKRQADKEKEIKVEDLNLATYYSEDYPVIFNIILWFSVVFAFSLLAISYAIATMDPGRDSIIYRMTSTRMKKDN